MVSSDWTRIYQLISWSFDSKKRNLSGSCNATDENEFIRLKDIIDQIDGCNGPSREALGLVLTKVDRLEQRLKHLTGMVTSLLEALGAERAETHNLQYEKYDVLSDKDDVGSFVDNSTVQETETLYDYQATVYSEEITKLLCEARDKNFLSKQAEAGLIEADSVEDYVKVLTDENVVLKKFLMYLTTEVIGVNYQTSDLNPNFFEFLSTIQVTGESNSSLRDKITDCKDDIVKGLLLLLCDSTYKSINMSRWLDSIGLDAGREINPDLQHNEVLEELNTIKQNINDVSGLIAEKSSDLTTLVTTFTQRVSNLLLSNQDISETISEMKGHLVSSYSAWLDEAVSVTNRELDLQSSYQGVGELIRTLDTYVTNLTGFRDVVANGTSILNSIGYQTQQLRVLSEQFRSDFDNFANIVGGVVDKCLEEYKDTLNRDLNNRDAKNSLSSLLLNVVYDAVKTTVDPKVIIKNERRF